MNGIKISVEIAGPDTSALLAGIQKAEEMGIPAAWLNTRSGLDALTVIAAAMQQTQRIVLGSAITIIYPIHPAALVRQIMVLEQLAPQRFRMGVGPGSKARTQEEYGVEFRAPLGHLREYLRIMKAMLQQGSVDFEGRHYRTRASIPAAMDVPVMASALGPKVFKLCGAEADGAIAWLTPGVYLRAVALPAMKEGARLASRPTPPLVAHAPVCLNEDFGEVRSAFLRQFNYIGSSPFYRYMLPIAGFPEVSAGDTSDALVDSIVLWGSESRVVERLKELFSWGAGEILVSHIPGGYPGPESLERTWRLVANVAEEVGRS